MLRRDFRAWSDRPPPPLLHWLLEQLGRGQPRFLYGTCLRGALSFFAHPATRMNGPVHRSSAHRHAMLSLPPLAILVLAGIWVGFPQGLHSHLHRCSFPGRAPWNGAWQDVSCFALLLHVALTGRLRDLEALDNLGTGGPFLNCAKDLLPHLLRICSHLSIFSPGFLFPQVPCVNKVSLQQCAERLSFHLLKQKAKNVILSGSKLLHTTVAVLC